MRLFSSKKNPPFFAADFYKFRDYYFCIGRIFILRKSVAAPPCLPCRPTFPFVGISHFFCFVSHGGITVPSGPTLLSVHFDISICDTCLPLSHVSMFWPSHFTRILCHTPNGSFVSNSDGTCPKTEPHVHVGFEKLSQELSAI